MVIKKFIKILSLLFLLCAAGTTAMEQQTHLSLISKDNRRFWLAPEVVANFEKLNEIYTKLGNNKYLRTNLDEVTLQLLKDLIIATHEKKNLQDVLKPFCTQKNITTAQCAALIQESARLQLPVITQAAADHLYGMRPELTLQEFQELGPIHSAVSKLCAIQAGDRVFLLPRESTQASPYLHAAFNSSFKEAQAGILVVPAEYCIDTVRFVKSMVELLHCHAQAGGKDFAPIKPLVQQRAEQFESLSVQTIALADQWALPEVAHTLVQVLLQRTPGSLDEIKQTIPAHCRKYIPPFKAEDVQRLKDHSLSYLSWIAKAQEAHYFDKSQQELADKLIDLTADNFDEHIREGDHAQAAPALQRLFKKPRMRAFTVQLNKELVKKNKITQEAPIVLQPYWDSLCHMKFSKMDARNFIVFAKNENPQIWNVHGQHLCTLHSDLLETMNSAIAHGPNHVITASYYKGVLTRDEMVHLKLWSIKKGNWPECQKIITMLAPGRPDVRLKVLADGKVAIGIYQSVRIWDPENNEIKFAEPIQGSPVLELEAPRDGATLDNERSVTTRDFPGPCIKMVIRQSNDRLPIQDIIKKRKQQVQREHGAQYSKWGI